MRGRLFAILGVLGVLVAGGVIYLTNRSEAPAPSPVTRNEAPPTPLATPAKPTPEAAAPRRASEPKPATPTPEPTPAAPTTGTLRIDSDVPGASVFIDRVYLGTTPITVPNVSVGQHRLNSSVTGYEGILETIDVEAGPRDIMLAFKIVKLDVKADVVHKHGVGSCAGTLSATPDGIRYTTTNNDDAFSAPLGDLTTFEIDYVDKVMRLKVKLKNGKTYNFSDPTGATDPLFNFQRDVEKVRKRLAGGGTSAQ